jgi:hypothetical protein
MVCAPAVDANDSLYAANSKFLLAVGKMAVSLMTELTAQLKAMSEAGQDEEIRCSIASCVFEK